jgi:hypothetical protein
VLRRSGWTLHEMVVSLSVMGAVLALVAHHASSQRRLHEALREAIAVREQVTEAGAIAERVVWAVSPLGGDVLAALDSVLEIRMPFGAAAVCASAPGRVTIPAPSQARGNALSAFSDTPEAGDHVAALFHDSLGTTWLNLRAAASPIADVCARFPGGSSGWTIALVEPIVVPPGSALRFARPVRLSLYRASDARWYLGAKEWNEALQRFNAIQPIAGPLRRYDAEVSRSGLAFVYRDARGAGLPAPVETSRIATVTILARGAAADGDSVSVVVSLRNAR